MTKIRYNYPHTPEKNGVQLIWEGKSEQFLELPEIKLRPQLIWDLRNNISKQWKNRLILGDSLLAMHSLIQEGFENQVQMVYMDPPYGIDFKPKDTVNQVAVGGYVDTWNDGLGSYLEHLRQRLLLIKHLLHPHGSIFLQIGQSNLHYVRCIMDEIFGADNCVNVITFRTAISTNNVTNIADHLLWYAKDKSQVFQRKLFTERPLEKIEKTFTYSDSSQKFKPQELVVRIKHKNKGKGGRTANRRKSRIFSIEYEGKSFLPPEGFEWRWDEKALNKLKKSSRLVEINGKLYGKRFESDFPYMILTNVWMDTSTSTFAARKDYAVHTNPKVIWRCMAMTTKPGDLILDPTLGSGTSIKVAEKYGRRWIGIDTNPASIYASLNRLLEQPFPVYRWNEKTGEFDYRKFTKASLSAIANEKEISDEFLYDKPVQTGKYMRFPRRFQLTVNSAQTSAPTEFSAMELKNLFKSLSIPNKNGEFSSVSQVAHFNLENLNTVGIKPLNNFHYFEVKARESRYLIICTPMLVSLNEMELINHIDSFFQLDTQSEQNWETIFLINSWGQLSWGSCMHFYKKFGPQSLLFNRFRLAYYHPILSVPQINKSNLDVEANLISFSSWIEFLPKLSADLVDANQPIYWALFPYELSDQYLSAQVKKISNSHLGIKYRKTKLKANVNKPQEFQFANNIKELGSFFSQFYPKETDNKQHVFIWDNRGNIHYGFME